MRNLLILTSLLLCSIVVKAQLSAHFTYNKFSTPGSQTSYIETYLAVIGPTVKYLPNEAGMQQANVQVTMVLKQEEAIVDFKKFNLKSPEVAAGKSTDFIDQQRFSVQNGSYELEVELLDLNDPGSDTLSATQVVKINFPAGEISISNLQLLNSYKKASDPGPYTKSGYDLVAAVPAFFDEGNNQLSFYGEIYNADVKFGIGEKFLTNYYIETYANEKTMGDFFRFNKQEAKPVNPVLQKFDISSLPAGGYNLVLEVRDRENKLVTKQKAYFEREKEQETISLEDLGAVDVSTTFAALYTDADSLRESLYSMHPIASELEKSIIDQQVPNGDLKMMQQFFYSFWQSRDNIMPEDAWKQYEAQVKKVHRMFGTRNKKGYQTDRGRVYLQYGAPNTLTDRPNEPSSYPYQIWHYYKIDRFNNKRFIFYSEELVTTDYVLLHCDIPGEPKDFRWQYRIMKRQNANESIDAAGGQDHYGNRIDDFYTNPR